MKRKKLDQLWDLLQSARRKPQKGSELESLAKMAGRTEHAGGNHPIWKSYFPNHTPVPIPRHGGDKEVSPIVKKTVLNHLEIDAGAWEELILQQESTEPKLSGE